MATAAAEAAPNEQEGDRKSQGSLEEDRNWQRSAQQNEQEGIMQSSMEGNRSTQRITRSVLLQETDKMSQRSLDSMMVMHRDEGEGSTYTQIHLPENISELFDSTGNIGFQVIVNLEREKDQNRAKRVKLANEVKAILDHQLENVVGYRPYYPSKGPVPNEEEIQALLFVDVALASDGNRCGRMLCGEFYVGSSKLVLVWCLQHKATDEVIMGQRCVQVDPAAVDGGEWSVKKLT